YHPIPAVPDYPNYHDAPLPISACWYCSRIDTRDRRGHHLPPWCQHVRCVSVSGCFRWHHRYIWSYTFVSPFLMQTTYWYSRCWDPHTHGTLSVCSTDHS